MFLKEVNFKNFRCFDDLKLSFARGNNGIRKWTILLGQNGSGKSNLLKGIALITAGSDALTKLLGNPDDWIQYHKKYCEIRALLVTKSGEERQISMRINRGDGPSDILIKNKESLSLLDDALEHAERNYFVIGYGAYRRLRSDSSLRSEKGDTQSQRRALNVGTLFDPDQPLVPLESWAMDLDYRKNTKGMDTIRKVLTAFLREVSFSRIDKDKQQLMFKTPDGIVPMHLLSDGYQNIASWVGDLLYRVSQTFDDYSKPLSARGVLLIDEIDLHLHPTWQRELLEFLSRRLPNLQLIVTTHSPITAQQASEGELHHLERVGKRIELNVFDGSPKTLLLHQLVMSDLFGIESDESREIASKKSEYRKLRSKQKDLTPTQQKRYVQLKQEISQMPTIQRSQSAVTTTQIDLLNKLRDELKAVKK